MKTRISKYILQTGLVALTVAIGNTNSAEAKVLNKDELANRVSAPVSIHNISSESVAIGQTMPGPYPGEQLPYPGGPGPFPGGPGPGPFPGGPGPGPFPGGPGPGPFPLPLPYPGGPGPFPLPIPFPGGPFPLPLPFPL